jgi:hypothetical protein
MEEKIKMTDDPIIIIYLNNILPKYARKNFQYLSKTFQNKRIVLVSNVKKNKSKIPSSQNIEFYFLEDFDQELSIFTQESRLPINFRNGFWISTIARFKALEIFMRNEGVKSAIHIEADVLLLWNFPFECDLLKTSKLAFPYVSEKIAAASIFFVGDISKLIDFNRFVVNSIRQNPEITDMGILAEYGKNNEESVTRLFSGFGFPNKDDGNYIFDAATFGMFLTGQDPKNSRGFIKKYFDIDDHAVKPSQINFRYTEENEAIVNLSDKDYILTNLHIHSKQSKYFSGKRSQRIIQNAITHRKKEESQSFSIEIWLILVARYLKKRILK